MHKNTSWQEEENECGNSCLADNNQKLPAEEKKVKK